MQDVYSEQFFSDIEKASRSGAEVMVPYIVELLRPKSMIDIGCGAGHWGLAFSEHGVETVHGVDGPWASEAATRLHPKNFTEFDFGQADPPFAVQTPQPRYDLLLSLELVEHVAPEKADALIDLFCSLSDTIIMSAAIPGQGGTHHVNEQWPEYWAEKLSQRGYIACDFIRPALLANGEVPFFYAQNTIGYFKGAIPDAVRSTADHAWTAYSTAARPLVHSKKWEKTIDTVQSLLGTIHRQREGIRKRDDMIANLQQKVQNLSGTK